MFKNKTRLGNNFHCEDRTPKYLNSGVVYGLCNESCYSECVRHMNVRIGEHTGMSPLTKKQINPKNSSAAEHWLFCNYSASHDEFSILAFES